MGSALQSSERPRKPIEELPIPAFPPVAIRVLQLVSDDDVEIKEVLDLMRGDPAFSAEILRRANSPAYGFKSQIESLQHALAVLGLRRIKVISMTVATRIYFRSALKIDELRRCWHHTLACGLLTEELARLSGVHEDRAYTAGLLHDVGRIGLLAAYPKEYSELLRQLAEQAASGEAVDVLAREGEAFGADHCEAGRRLIEKWKLPEEFARVAARHHEAAGDDNLDLRALVSAGCRLADALGFDVVPSPARPSLDEILTVIPEGKRHRFNLDPEWWRELAESRMRMLDLPDFDVHPPKPDTEAEAAPVPAAAAAPALPAPVEDRPSRTWSQDAILVVVGGLLLAAAFILIQQFVAPP